LSFRAVTNPARVQEPKRPFHPPCISLFPLRGGHAVFSPTLSPIPGPIEWVSRTLPNHAITIRPISSLFDHVVGRCPDVPFAGTRTNEPPDEQRGASNPPHFGIEIRQKWAF
jgi:hypothetical protein